MYCVQETETLNDSFTSDKDPLDTVSQQLDSDDEPSAKQAKLSYTSPGINLQVYQIPAFNIPKSLSIYTSTSTSTTLPKFVNNPLNLANPLSITTNGNFNANGKPSMHIKRYSLPAKLPLQVTPQKSGPSTPQKAVFDSGGAIVRYKKNGEVAKKRGPPKGYKRKPKIATPAGIMHTLQLQNLSPGVLQNLSPGVLQNITTGVLQQAQNLILQGLLATSHGSQNIGSTASSMTISPVPPPQLNRLPPQLTIVPQITVPPGVELVELDLHPADWFPEEPYKMSFSRKKNPKWKSFPFRCEHCFKGYRVVSTLLQHAAERHGSVPRDVAIPCPCCPHVSTRRKQHKKHVESHEGRRHRIFCVYCVPLPDPTEPFQKEADRFPFDKYPQYWYASEESLRLHKKRKHPYAAMFNYNWFSTWGDSMPNS